MTLKTYHIVEIDANDQTEVLRRGLTRNEARERLNLLRADAKERGLLFRYVMYRDKTERPYNPAVGSHLWTGNIKAEGI